MCRYAMHGLYKTHYVCFPCRRSFKQWTDRGRLRVRCPECGGAAHNLGLYFKAPRKEDVKQWEKVRLLFQHGYTFGSCGCNGPGGRPKTLKEVEPFLVAQRELQAAQKRASEIRARAEQLTMKRNRKTRLTAEKRIKKIIDAHGTWGAYGEAVAPRGRQAG